MRSQTIIKSAKQSFIRVFLLLGMVLFCFDIYANNRWNPLSPGIEYQDLAGSLLAPWSHIYVFRIDLHSNKLEIVNAKSLKLNNASADQFAENSKALISINGGFFDRHFNPLGLRINNKQLENPLKNISWWGIFYIKHQQAFISSLKNFKVDQSIDFAMQSGPRLIINGRIPSLKAGIADRSALGITRDGRVILLVSTNATMSTQQLAQLMRAPPLKCVNAINLDGGSSSQLHAHIGVLFY